MSFGHPVPKEVLASRGHPKSYWGARAIFHPSNLNPIDIVHDRTTFEPQGVKLPMLLYWLNTEALPWLRKNAARLSTSSREVLEYKESDNYTLMASPNGSYGYMYIGAWRYDPENCTYEDPEPTPNKKWSGDNPIPKRGDRVFINFNELNWGTVLDYFAEYDYQGVRCSLDKQPDWHARQRPNNPIAMVFGQEIDFNK